MWGRYDGDTPTHHNSVKYSELPRESHSRIKWMQAHRIGLNQSGCKGERILTFCRRIDAEWAGFHPAMQNILANIVRDREFPEVQLLISVQYHQSQSLLS